MVTLTMIPWREAPTRAKAGLHSRIGSLFFLVTTVWAIDVPKSKKIWKTVGEEIQRSCSSTNVERGKAGAALSTAAEIRASIRRGCEGHEGCEYYGLLLRDLHAVVIKMF